VLWGAQGAIARWYDVVATWQERATDVRGKALPGGHWLPEQVPDELYTELMAFLR
jgi:haloacetate dehalogenase